MTKQKIYWWRLLVILLLVVGVVCWYIFIHHWAVAQSDPLTATTKISNWGVGLVVLAVITAWFLRNRLFGKSPVIGIVFTILAIAGAIILSALPILLTKSIPGPSLAYNPQDRGVIEYIPKPIYVWESDPLASSFSEVRFFLCQEEGVKKENVKSNRIIFLSEKQLKTWQMIMVLEPISGENACRNRFTSKGKTWKVFMSFVNAGKYFLEYNISTDQFQQKKFAQLARLWLSPRLENLGWKVVDVKFYVDNLYL